MFPWLRSIPTLVKYRVSLAVTFTSLISYLLFTGGPEYMMFYLALGVFMLAGGASAMNQVQERKYDERMQRTRHRPLPSGMMSIRQAIFISILFIVTGLVVLFLFCGPLNALLGLFNILWYNLFYTNLKKVTAMAIVPGSLTGAVPALIGWTAAGGDIVDPRIIFVAFFLFIWQVPHFWLLLIKYRKEYEDAGFPSINRSIRPENLRKISYTWIIATSIVSLMFPLFNIITSIPLFIGILALNAWFVITFTRFTFKDQDKLNFRAAFISFNAYLLLFLVLLVVSQLW